jgi:hypothetical protein
MATSSVLARVGLVSAVAVILGISTLSPLLKPAPDFGRVPMVNGPPLYQTAAMPLPAERAATATPANDARAKPVRLTSSAVALLGLPQRPVAERPVAPAGATTAVAPSASPLQQPPPQQQQQAQPAQAAAATAADPDALQPPPLVAESESAPKPEKRAATPKKTKKVRTQQPPVYTRAVQMHIY